MPIAAALPAIISGVATVGGALLSSSASKKAGQSQERAADKGAETQLQMFETARSDLQPFRQIGQNALTSLAQMYGIAPTASSADTGGAEAGGATAGSNSQLISALEAIVNSGGGGGGGGAGRGGVPLEPHERNLPGSGSPLQDVPGGSGPIYDSRFSLDGRGGAQASGLASPELQSQLRQVIDALKAQEATQTQLPQQGQQGQIDVLGEQPFDPFSESELEAFRNSPDYQVAMREGIDTLDRSAAARGNLMSGGQMRRVMEVGSDIGSRHFGSYLDRKKRHGDTQFDRSQIHLDRLSNLAGMGQNAAAGQASGALSTGRGVARSQLDSGAARAAGLVGSANAINQGLGDAANNYAFMHYMNQPRNSAYSGSLPTF